MSRERYEFLAAVGHELRTPLTSIRGYVETLLDEEVDAATSRRFLETVRREALRLGRLVDGMLDFSLLDLSAAAAPASTNVAEAVAAAMDALAPLAGARGVRFARTGASSAYARIDEDTCVHALRNLIENALKHGRCGGLVVVSVWDDAPWITIAIDDDGPGVPPDEREQIFVLRVRGNGARTQGWGIGLALVKRIVERVAGTIAVSRSPLGGARFMLRLPASIAPKAESASTTS